MTQDFLVQGSGAVRPCTNTAAQPHVYEANLNFRRITWQPVGESNPSSQVENLVS